jgi:hypothetical protein
MQEGNNMSIMIILKKPTPERRYAPGGAVYPSAGAGVAACPLTEGRRRGGGGELPQIGGLSHQPTTVRKRRTIVLHFSLTCQWARQRRGEEDMHLLSWVVQRRQEGCDGELLSHPDVVPGTGLCPLLHGSQLCLLPKRCVGPEGGRGPQMSDTPGALGRLPQRDLSRAADRGADLGGPHGNLAGLLHRWDPRWRCWPLGMRLVPGRKGRGRGSSETPSPRCAAGMRPAPRSWR